MNLGADCAVITARSSQIEMHHSYIHMYMQLYDVGFPRCMHCLLQNRVVEQISPDQTIEADTVKICCFARAEDGRRMFEGWLEG